MPSNEFRCFTGMQPLEISSPVEDKPETPGEMAEAQSPGSSGARPLGLGIAVLPPLPPDMVSGQLTPSQIAQKKRTSPLPTPPPPPRLDPEVSEISHIKFSSFTDIEYEKVRHYHSLFLSCQISFLSVVTEKHFFRNKLNATVIMKLLRF